MTGVLAVPGGAVDVHSHCLPPSYPTPERSGQQLGRVSKGA